jgi:mitotic spindle assembly checkpoint protein MAD2
MSVTEGPTRSKLALRGSAKLVSEFFGEQPLPCCELIAIRIQYQQVTRPLSLEFQENQRLTRVTDSVLYQRGIYPPEDFKVVKKYGLNVLVTTDDEVKSYIKRIMAQLSRIDPRFFFFFFFFFSTILILL